VSLSKKQVIMLLLGWRAAVKRKPGVDGVWIASIAPGIMKQAVLEDLVPVGVIVCSLNRFQRL